MARRTRIVNMSLPDDIYEEVDELAREKGISRSELLRQALKQYTVSERNWRMIYKWGEESAKKLGVRDEGDVDNMVHEFRKEQAAP